METLLSLFQLASITTNYIKISMCVNKNDTHHIVGDIIAKRRNSKGGFGSKTAWIKGHC
jgi:hypothetical protein